VTEFYESSDKELPDLRAVGRAISDGARERPWAATGAALLAGYLLGGGLFTRPTRWLTRAALGALAVPRVREGALEALRRMREPARAATPATAPF
jgi:hypothetical protein